MRILALEFSPPERSIAVMVDGQVRGHGIDRTPRGTSAFALIARALAEARIERESIECLAIGLGPGSYAGTRVAISIGQGWQLARGTKLIGLGSAEAIARAAQRGGASGTVNIVFDAQRNEAYARRYEIAPAGVRALGSFELLTVDEEARRRAGGEIFFKADDGPWGRGQHPVLLSDARIIGEMAAEPHRIVTGDGIEPVYLRKAEFIKAPPPKFKVPES